MRNLIARRKQEVIKRKLKRAAVVIIIGQRQVGKTTLALEVSKDMDAHYMDLSKEATAREVRKKGLDKYIEEHGKYLTIIDEVQAHPYIFVQLRSIIDMQRTAGVGKGRFLLLGSASLAITNRSKESLLGRISFAPLDPLDLLEISVPDEMDKLWLRGGLPDSFTANNDEESSEIREDIVEALSRWELPGQGLSLSQDQIEDLLTVLAYQHGGPLNKAKIAEELRLDDQRSVEECIKELANLLIIRKLPAFRPRRVSIFNKTPKIYYRDSGFLHQLLKLHDMEQLHDSHMEGRSWEGFAIENIMRQTDDKVTGSYFRTQNGTEMDLVLKFPKKGPVWGIEIKKGNPGVSSGFYAARDIIEPDRCFVVHGRSDIARYHAGQGVEIIPLPDMCREVAAELRRATGSNAGSAPPGSKPE